MEGYKEGSETTARERRGCVHFWVVYSGMEWEDSLAGSSFLRSMKNYSQRATILLSVLRPIKKSIPTQEGRDS